MIFGVLSCVRPTRDIVALINMPQTSYCFILHLYQSLSIATLASGLFTAFGIGVDLCTMHVVVQRRNVTSFRDVVLMSLSRTLCSSNSLRFDDYVLMILI